VIRKLGTYVVALCLAACSQGGAAPSELSPDLEAGHEVYSSICATCHGGNGDGGSAPALTGVLTTFSSCVDQIRWITLGSKRYEAEVGATYGDTGKEITAVMPEFGKSLSETEIAQVAAFERHRFGGAAEQEAVGDCGL
jgi:mono/diheme cytochrome c family protein